MLSVPTMPAPVSAPMEELLATLAHELRDPLATILFALQSNPDDRDADSAAQWSRDVAVRQARRAMRIVDDVFDVCAISRGRMFLQKEIVDLADIVADSTETTAHLFAARRHRLTVSLPPEPVFLDADSLRLEQVLTNLLTNAAKFTNPAGHIRLTAMVDGQQIAVRIQDNGRGIDAELMPRLFDLFHQGVNAGDQASGGLGIGLALVKSLVELHGGSIAAFSDGPGTGSEFVVCLPTQARDENFARKPR